jgi:hypothetical protein
MLSDRLEGITIILLGLISKTEEDKEDEGAEDNDPALELQSKLSAITPYQRRNLLDMGEIKMNILPTDVWVKGSASLNTHAGDGNWDIEHNIKASKAHESNETTGGNVVMA